MLEKLHTINWSQIMAYDGPAIDVPGAIQNLLSIDPEVRKQARNILHFLLEDQGLIYQAAAYTIPFLLEILTHSQGKDKREILQLMAYLGDKDIYDLHEFQFLEKRLGEDLEKKKDERRKPEALSPQDQSFEIWREQAYQAIHEGLPVFIRLLDDTDPAIRMEVTYVLTWFKQDSSRLLPTIVSQLLTETNVYVVSCLLLCLGELSPPTSDVLSLLLSYLDHSEQEFLQFAASLALCALSIEHLPLKVIDMLFFDLIDSSHLRQWRKHIPDVWRYRSGVLFYLDQLVSSSYQTVITERLIEIFSLLDMNIDRACADLLLRIAFYDKKDQFQQYSAFNRLNMTQQAILKAFVAKETLWSYHIPYDGTHETMLGSEEAFGKTSSPVSLNMLRNLRLPSTLPMLQAFISTTDRYS